VRAYVHDYAHHNYPGGTVQSLMSHADIVSNLAVFTPDVKAATNVGKEYVLGETNSGILFLPSYLPSFPNAC
jgi:hypothetical protein